MKILVCQVYFKLKKDDEEKIVEIDLKDFFNRVNNLSKNKKTFQKKNQSPILMEIKKILPNEKFGISFYKYRDDVKPYVEATDGDLTLLEDTLVELTTGYLDYSNGLLYLQFNYHGLNINRIEEYLNKFITNSNLTIHIDKLYKDFTTNLIYNSSRIKEVFIKFKSDTFETLLPKKTSILGFIRAIQEDRKEVLEVKLDTKHGGTFKGSTLREFIESSLENEGIEDILVRYKNRNGKLEKISIKKKTEELYFLILEKDKNKNSGWEYILNNIYKNYVDVESQALKIVGETLCEMEIFEDKVEVKEVSC